VSGSRRARALATAVQSSLASALALADRLDDQATAIEDGAGTGPGDLDADHDAQSAAGTLPAELVAATELVYAQASGLAGAGWAAAAWRGGDVAASWPAGVPRPRFRPGLWRVGRVSVPARGLREIPLALPLLDAGNLRITAPRDRRAEAVDLVRGLLTRILAAAPPGRVELTVYDPAELGAGLAGFAPLRAAGVAGPTLTSRTRLEAALGELSAEVGRITVDRLGGSFASLREREDAGLPRVEPWRLLVLLAWPALADEATRALLALAAQGPSCGVHVIAVTEPADPELLPARPAPPLPNEVVLTAAGPGRWRCSLAQRLDCALDVPPPADLVAAVAASIAAAAAAAAARAPGLGALLPDGLWEHDSAAGLEVPVAFGPDGACALRFDDDTVHGLVGGQAGAGKSTLLLDVIYGLAARYGPDQLRFHLLDFKEGLEFAQFAPRPHDPFFLPHADTVGMDSDREFGVAVLRHVRGEMTRRSVAMRAAGARDLRGLRMTDHSSAWPRIVVVVDEFQVMLTPLDVVAREAVTHLEVLARQGRAYGIHLLLASQTLSGIDALDATAGKRGSIFGQFALRVALRTSIGESRVLLSTANEAAGALSGVGQAIVNRRNGHPAGNELVRVARPDPDTIADLRARLAKAVAVVAPASRPPRVFSGHAPAVLDENPAFVALHAGSGVLDRADGFDAEDPDGAFDLADPAGSLDLDADGMVSYRPGTSRGPGSGPGSGRSTAAAYARSAGSDGFAANGEEGEEDDGGTDDPLAFVGVPLDLHPPAVGVRLAPQPGRNLAVLGPLRREAVGVLQAAVRSLAAQVPPGGLRVDLVSVSAETGPAVAALAAALRPTGVTVTAVDVTGLAAVVADAASEVGRRESAGLAGRAGAGWPIRVVVLFAADAGRAALEAPSITGRRSGLEDLRLVTRRGPAVRVHLLGWWRGPSRLLDDLGAGHRDDIAAWVAVGVPGSDLFALAGHRTVVAGTTPNRGVLFDRHAQAEPRTVVPFAPLPSPGRSGPGGTGDPFPPLPAPPPGSRVAPMSPDIG
jgi:hypothetical protein